MHSKTQPNNSHAPINNTKGTVNPVPSPTQNSPEHVVLLTEDGQPQGSHPKATVHHNNTPLHLAFSSYLFTPDHKLLLTRRALGKVAWPGVWTNTCCGHPGVDEAPVAAAGRRLGFELNVDAPSLTEVLPDFRYRAVDVSGIVENEICPVFAGVVDEMDIVPNPDEVCDWGWVPWTVVVTMAAQAAPVLSPWSVLQVSELAKNSWHPDQLVAA